MTSITIIFGWTNLAFTCYKIQDAAVDFASLVWTVGAVHGLMFSALVDLTLVKPAVHLKHRRTINAGVRLCLAGTFRVSWFIVLC
jgi:hypothetical protein